MRFLDARRLTGPSLLFDGPACILDVACTADEADRLVPVWADNVGRMLEALDWQGPVYEVAAINGRGTDSLCGDIMVQLVDYGEVRRGRLGAQGQDLTPLLAQAFSIERRMTVWIMSLSGRWRASSTRRA